MIKIRTKIGFFLVAMVSLLMVASIAHAASYSCGLSVDEEWTLKVTKKDTDVIVDAYGSVENWHQTINTIIYHWTSTNEAMYELGAKMKIKVTGIEDGATSWTVKMTLWDWTTSSFSSSGIDTEMTIVKDPTDLYWNTQIFFVAIPVNTYLQNMGYITNYEGKATISDTTVVVDLDGSGFIEYEATYDSITGKLTNFQMQHNDQVMYEISTGTVSGGDTSSSDSESGSSGIPGYDAFILLGVATLSICVAILSINRKNKEF